MRTGLAAQKLNAFINIKTAADLQNVGQNVQSVINSELMVDEWSVKYVGN